MTSARYSIFSVWLIMNRRVKEQSYDFREQHQDCSNEVTAVNQYSMFLQTSLEHCTALFLLGSWFSICWLHTERKLWWREYPLLILRLGSVNCDKELQICPGEKSWTKTLTEDCLVGRSLPLPFYARKGDNVAFACSIHWAPIKIFKIDFLPKNVNSGII